MWLHFAYTDEELNACLKKMRESWKELQIHVKCSHMKVTHEWVTVNNAEDVGGGASSTHFGD